MTFTQLRKFFDNLFICKSSSCLVRSNCCNPKNTKYIYCKSCNRMFDKNRNCPHCLLLDTPSSVNSSNKFVSLDSIFPNLSISKTKAHFNTNS